MANKAITPTEVREAERARPTDELGATGLASFCGLVEEAYIAELYYPSAYAKFNEMRRRNPTIASLLNAINLLARTASWSVEPAGTTDPDKRAAEFLEQCIGDMSFTLEDAVEDMLSAIWFGWSWSEVVYKRRKGAGADPESKYDDQLVGWRKFAPRRQSSFMKWELDEGGGVQGMWQTIINDPNKMTRYVPISKSLHFTAQRDMGNPEGLPLAEHVYEPWHFVKNLQIINGIGFERSFVGLPVFTYGTADKPYEPTEEDKSIIERTGKGLRVGEKSFIALPGQIGFDLKTTANPNATSLLETIKYYLIVILQTALADFIALGTTSTGGSYALGADKSQLFLMAVDGWLDKLAHCDKLGILNRYAVPRLFGYNTFDGITDYPKIKHSSVQKPDLTALAAYLQSLTAYIHPDALLEADLRKKANLPEAEEPDPNAPQPPVDSQQSPVDGQPIPADAQVQNDPAPDGAEPTTGEDDGAQDIAMTEPHPPARGQRWYFLSQWRKLAGEFRDAMLASDEGGKWVTVNGSPVFIKSGQSVGDAMKERFGEKGGGGGSRDKVRVATKMQHIDVLANESQSRGEKLYVRWSRGYELDKKQKFSVDQVSGSSHNGLSAQEIRPGEPKEMARVIQEYQFLKRKDPNIQPWLYSGHQNGTDSDGAPTIAADSMRVVGKIDKSLIEKADRYNKAYYTYVSKYANNAWKPEHHARNTELQKELDDALNDLL